MKSDFAIHRPKPVLLPSFTSVRRKAPRPLALRDPDFDAQFDDEVLFFDCFYRQDGRIGMVGPSLHNLRSAIKAGTFRSGLDGAPLAFRVIEMDRCAQVIVDAPQGLKTLTLECEFGTTEIEIQPMEVDAFAGRRVVITISKDNKLVWIRDWLNYACRVHGANAIVIYDNGSTLYSHEELLETIASVEGLAAARVVPWPFKFGPQGTLARGSWDSDYCQLGAWEHVRWKYLSSAKSVQNSDIDELVVSSKGQSNFAAAEASHFGFLKYRGRWIVGTSNTDIPSRDPSRRHRDYNTVLRKRFEYKYGIWPREQTACFPKWTVVPSKCPAYAQWKMHTISNWLPALRVSRTFSFRHFREISDSWKYLRSDRPEFDPDVHEYDSLMDSHFSRL